MDCGIQLEIVWFDDDLVELRVRGFNGCFSGTADLYAGHHALAKVADAFRGFPASVDDRRELEIGTFDPKYAGGGVRFRLFCRDRVGHSVLQLEFRTDPRHLGLGSESAEFFILVEPAAIDGFVAAVAGLPIEVGAGALLRAAI